MTEKEKMLSGELYFPGDEQLAKERLRARKLLDAVRRLPPDQEAERNKLFRELFGKAGKEFLIEPSFSCDYGSNIQIGERFFANFGCVILDPAPVALGDDVLLGPNVQIYTAGHPLDFELRRKGFEYARPVFVGNGVWVGGGAVLCPGVSIGDHSVIGAGSVVTGEIPAGVLAAGNPCRVIRKIENSGKNSCNRHEGSV